MIASGRRNRKDLVLLIFLIMWTIQNCDCQSRDKRQGWNWDDEQPISSSTPPSGTTGPPTDQSECQSRCPQTPQYNPVCGTNGETYDNESKLLCAKKCGVKVNLLTNGRCSTVTGTTTGGDPFVTPPPSSKECLRACRTGSKYQPVCGTDGKSYDNVDKLRCANQCGSDVEFLSNGVCSSGSISDDKYQKCVKKCPTLGGYNPICGSDNKEYQNESHLECARNCGRSIEKLLDGKCPVTG